MLESLGAATNLTIGAGTFAVVVLVAIVRGILIPAPMYHRVVVELEKKDIEIARQSAIIAGLTASVTGMKDTFENFRDSFERFMRESRRKARE